MTTTGRSIRHLAVILRSPSIFHYVRRLCSAPSPETPAAAGVADFAISYLVSSCGLSPTVAARSATTSRLRFTSPEKPDSVLHALRSYGFTQSHITRLISQYPRVLYYDVDANLKPKLEFYTQLGVGPRELCSLPRTLIPNLNRLRLSFESFVKAVGSEEVVTTALRRHPLLITYDIEERIKPNLVKLRQFGLMASSIRMLIAQCPCVLTRSQDQLVERIERLKEMGLEPSSKVFAYCLIKLIEYKTSSWDNKIQFFRDLGWKDNEILDAFKRYPSLMGISREKVKKMVGFYEETLGWGKDVVLVYVNLLSCSLEKKVMPRLLVLDILRSKGELNRRCKASDLICSEEIFVNKFVAKYAEKYPELTDAYKVKDGGDETEKMEKKIRG